MLIISFTCQVNEPFQIDSFSGQQKSPFSLVGGQALTEVKLDRNS